MCAIGLSSTKGAPPAAEGEDEDEGDGLCPGEDEGKDEGEGPCPGKGEGNDGDEDDDEHLRFRHISCAAFSAALNSSSLIGTYTGLPVPYKIRHVLPLSSLHAVAPIGIFFSSSNDVAAIVSRSSSGSGSGFCRLVSYDRCTFLVGPNI